MLDTTTTGWTVFVPTALASLVAACGWPWVVAKRVADGISPAHVSIVSYYLTYGFLAWVQCAQQILLLLYPIRVPIAEIEAPGSCMLFPLTLTLLLYLYLADKPAVFGRVLLWVVVVNAGVGLCLYQGGDWLASVLGRSPELDRLCKPESVTCLVRGTGLFALEAVMLPFLYSAWRRVSLTQFDRLAVPLLAALLFDAWLFSWAIHDTGVVAAARPLEAVTVDQAVSKGVCGLLYTGCVVLSLYLGLWEPKPAAAAGEGPLRFLLSAAATLAHRLARAYSWAVRSLGLTTHRPGAMDVPLVKEFKSAEAIDAGHGTKTARCRACNGTLLEGRIVARAEGTLDITEDMDVPPHWDESAATFEQERAELVQHHLGKWVAYVKRERIGLANSKDDLLVLCHKKGLPVGAAYITLVEAETETGPVAWIT